MRYGYARVSTDDQHLDRQRHALEAEGCARIVEEVESGVKARRRLEGLLEQLRGGDELVIEQIDRLGRSAASTILLMDELFQRGVVLRVLALPALDYATPAGRYVAQTFAALAELFRSESRQRQRQGIDAARRAGRHLGRAPSLTGQQIDEGRRMIDDDGRPPAEVARLFRVHPKTLRRAIKRSADAMQKPDRQAANG